MTRVTRTNLAISAEVAPIGEVWQEASCTHWLCTGLASWPPRRERELRLRRTLRTVGALVSLEEVFGAGLLQRFTDAAVSASVVRQETGMDHNHKAVRQRKRQAERNFAAAEREGMRRMKLEEQGVKYPDVQVQLVGGDGNVYAVIGAVSAALRRAGHADAAKEFSRAAMQSGSYDAVLQLCLQTVDVS